MTSPYPVNTIKYIIVIIEMYIVSNSCWAQVQASSYVPRFHHNDVTWASMSQLTSNPTIVRIACWGGKLRKHHSPHCTLWGGPAVTGLMCYQTIRQLHLYGLEFQFRNWNWSLFQFQFRNCSQPWIWQTSSTAFIYTKTTKFYQLSTE